MIRLLNAIYKLGKLYLEKEGLNEFEVWVGNNEIVTVILINFIRDSKGNLFYDKIVQEDYDLNNKVKYLYRKGASNGVNISPSAIITKNSKNTFNKKLFKWFEKNWEYDVLFEQIYDILKYEKENIIDDLNNFYNDLNLKNKNVLLTLRITENDSNNYLNDYEIFREIFKKNTIEKYYISSLTSNELKDDSICFLCNEFKTVYGLVSSAMGFGFSTPEKKGNIPGCTIENQLKLLPICEECALNLEAGKKFIEKFLIFKEFGLTFYVIPDFLFDSEDGFSNLYLVLKTFEKIGNQNSKEEVDIENILFQLVKNVEDIVEFKFLFYKSSKNEFNIMSYIESVIPSWLTELYEAQYKISKFDFFNESNLKNIFGKKYSDSFIDNYKKQYCTNYEWFKPFLKDFSFKEGSSIKNPSDKLYVDLVSNIISNKKLSYNFLISLFIDKIRYNWRDKKKWVKGISREIKMSVVESLMLLILFNNLDLIKGDDKMNVDDEFKLNLILNTSDKKASFLLGVLTRNLINKQYNELNSSPFYNKLWGLSLNQKRIKKLYPMVVNKLREYDVYYYNDLEEEISNNLLNSENNWKLNGDETSYFFVLGFTMPYFCNGKTEVDLNE